MPRGDPEVEIPPQADDVHGSGVPLLIHARFSRCLSESSDCSGALPKISAPQLDRYNTQINLFFFNNATGI
jgi:hypothetical protein